MKEQLAYVRKLLVYVAGVLAVLTGLGIYQAKNEPIPGRVPTEV